MKTCLSVLAVLICAGCASTNSKPHQAFRRDCEGLLWALNDSGTQNSMIKIAGQFDELMSTHSRESLVATLKRIAQDDSHLRPLAIKMLSRYMSVQDHSQFKLSLKKTEHRSDNKTSGGDVQ
jgi:hypothetical protein